jgi:sugar/nucleoside kinase (ribokinase family)
MKKMYQNQGKELADMFKRVKQLGVVTSLDMTLPDPASESGTVDWKKILKNTLCNVDIFTPSIEEVSYMLDGELFQKRKKDAAGQDPVLFYQPDDYTGLSETIFEYGCPLTVIKSGINGLYLRTADKNKLDKTPLSTILDTDKWSNRYLWAPSFKAEKIASATGAGDATIAGFMAAVVRGCPPDKALNIANTVGWENVRNVDALSGIEDWDATLSYMQQKKRARNELELEKHKWKWSDDLDLYVGPNDNV